MTTQMPLRPLHANSRKAHGTCVGVLETHELRQSTPPYPNDTRDTNVASGHLEGSTKPQIKCIDYEGENLMTLQEAAKGVGSFVLFLLLYMVIGAIVSVIALYLIDNWIIHKLISFISNSDDLYEHILQFSIAIVVGSSGVPLSIAAYTAIIKTRPTQRIGVAFILWLTANYVLHFTIAPEQTDWTVYYGLTQSIFACLAAWLEFRLPPVEHGSSTG
jgi:hypothetical protein